jgi:hypothetical protein
VETRGTLSGKLLRKKVEERKVPTRPSSQARGSGRSGSGCPSQPRCPQRRAQSWWPSRANDDFNWNGVEMKKKKKKKSMKKKKKVFCNEHAQ